MWIANESRHTNIRAVKKLSVTITNADELICKLTGTQAINYLHSGGLPGWNEAADKTHEQRK